MNKLTAIFQKPDHMVIALQEYHDAQRELLAAQSGLDYARAMVDYQQSRITRLRTLLTMPTGGIAVVSPCLSDTVVRADIAQDPETRSETR